VQETISCYHQLSTKLNGLFRSLTSVLFRTGCFSRGVVLMRCMDTTAVGQLHGPNAQRISCLLPTDAGSPAYIQDLPLIFSGGVKPVSASSVGSRFKRQGPVAALAHLGWMLDSLAQLVSSPSALT
jgi:hypothetical protein